MATAGSEGRRTRSRRSRTAHPSGGADAPPHRRAALCIAMQLAAGHASVSPAHEPPKVRTCGAFRHDGQPVGVVIEKGKPTCATAKKVLRTYLRSHAPCRASV